MNAKQFAKKISNNDKKPNLIKFLINLSKNNGQQFKWVNSMSKVG